MDDSPEYRAACCRMRTLRGFYHHLMIFLLVNGGLLIVNLLGNPAHLWAMWPLSLWGCFVVAHGVAALRRERRQCLEAHCNKAETSRSGP